MLGTIRARLQQRFEPLAEVAATSVEYALMASLIAVVVIAAVVTLGSATEDKLCEPTMEWASVSDSVETGVCD